jgi:hypothetical protein
MPRDEPGPHKFRTLQLGGGSVIGQKEGAVWAGWGGTALFLICWLTVWWISSFSLFLWAGLMCLGAIMCFYGGVYRSRWFFLPGLLAVVVAIGVFVAGRLE